jgi:hypothetical protein
VPMHTTCNTCRGTGAKPGTTPVRSAVRAGYRDPGTGHVLDLPAMPLCGGSGTIIEGRAHVPWPGAGARSSACGKHARRGAGSRIACRARAAGRRGGPPGICTSSPMSRHPRCSNARARTSGGGSPEHSRRCEGEVRCRPSTE